MQLFLRKQKKARLFGIDISPSRVSVIALYRDKQVVGVAGFGVVWRDDYADVTQALLHS